jgi:isopentenyldiphosphate isomerase
VDGAEFQKLDSEKKIFAAKETYGLHRGFLKSSFERIGHASSEEIFYLEGDSSLTAFSEAESVLGLSSKDLLHVFLITPSFKELLSRVSIQFSAGHFAKDEMDVRLAEGVKYLSKSEERLSNFPRSIYLVNDEVERIESVLRALVTPGGYQSLVLELEEPGAPRRISTKVASHKADALHDIAVLYLFDKDGKLLLQKRADNGKWDHSVGGHMLPGESAQEAIVREAEEELGITQLSCESVLQDFRPEPSFTKSRKHRFNVFKASFDESVLNLSDETTETERFSPEDLREKMKENPDLFEEGLLATFPELK